jgi:hypothetical protein
VDRLEPKSPANAIDRHLRRRPRLVLLKEWLSGRRYRVCSFRGRKWPAFVIAHKAWDAGRVADLERALDGDWADAPANCREVYDEILLRAPKVIVIQWRRANVCGCLGHRHLTVREPVFALPHDALGGEAAGEMDIAGETIRNWQALPLTDTALDAQFLEGSRLEDFRLQQYRFKLLSVVLHEINHLVYPLEPETSVRERSMTFYREALASYAQNALSTLSFTIDRSFSRLG